MLHTSEGIEIATGALQGNQFPGCYYPYNGNTWVMCGFFPHLKKIKNPYKTPLTFMVWFIVLSAVILTPAVGTTYYLPKIAGEDYSINGMRWLGENGQIHEKVIGYGYRTVPVFTNMPSPSVEDGSETRLFTQLLQNIHFSSGDQERNVNNLRQIFVCKIYPFIR